MHMPPGLNTVALGRWLAAEHPGLVAGELTATLLAGGRSNLTYRVSDGHGVWAVRRPPLTHVLPTAHDMRREFTVLDALSDTKVPVPSPIALCIDPDVIGAPFYVMDFVDGTVLDSAAAIEGLGAGAAAHIGDALVDTLAQLHSINPSTVGLGAFGRPDGFLQRQLRRWHQQWQASETRPLAIESEIVDALAALVPTPQSAAIVHGDYRLTNVIFINQLSRIGAVLDWEMATIGDPLTDVGVMHVYHEMSESGATAPHLDPTRGFLTARQMSERYGAASGRDISNLQWYIAFGYFKIAVITEGIAFRHRQDDTVGEGDDTYADHAPWLLQRAAAALTTI